MTTLTRPTAIGDPGVYSVSWPKKGQHQGHGKVHGVIGRECRVTLCSLYFIHVGDPYVDAAIDCLTCLAHLKPKRHQNLIGGQPR